MLLVRFLALILALPLLAIGGAALVWGFFPDAPLSGAIRDLTDQALAAIGAADRLGGAAGLEEKLVAGKIRYVPAAMGVLLLIVGIWPNRKSESNSETQEAEDGLGLAPVEKSVLKKARKEAAALARSGDLAAAGELLFSHSDLEAAAKYFEKGEAFERVAEIRHDQNRFVESAELYVKAGKYETAGSVFSQQGEYARAAECFLEIGSLGVAAVSTLNDSVLYFSGSS